MLASRKGVQLPKAKATKQAAAVAAAEPAVVPPGMLPPLPAAAQGTSRAPRPSLGRCGSLPPPPPAEPPRGEPPPPPPGDPAKIFEADQLLERAAESVLADRPPHYNPEGHETLSFIAASSGSNWEQVGGIWRRRHARTWYDFLAAAVRAFICVNEPTAAKAILLEDIPGVLATYKETLDTMGWRLHTMIPTEVAYTIMAAEEVSRNRERDAVALLQTRIIACPPKGGAADAKLVMQAALALMPERTWPMGIG